MKKKIFDLKLYIQGLKNLRLIGIMSMVIMMMQAILVPMTIYVSQQAARRSPYYSNGDVSFGTYQVELMSYQPLLYIVGIFIMPMMVRSLFQFLNKRNASDFYHSLPVTRVCLYLSYLAAALTWYLALFIIPSVVFCILLNIPEGYKLVTDTIMISFCSVTTLGLLLSSAILVAMGLTGTKFTNTAVAVMILILPRCYILYFQAMVRGVADYVVFSPENILWNNKLNLLFSLFTGGMNAWNSILYTFVLSLIYFSIAGVLFKIRKSEKANQVAISPRMQMVIRIIPSLTFCFIPIALLVSYIEENKDGYGEYLGELLFYLGCLYLIAMVIYFLYELITTKKLRAIIKAVPGLLVLFSMNIVIIALIYIYSFFASQMLPSANQIDYVRILDYDYSWSRDYYEEQLTKVHWDDERLKVLVADGLRNTVEDVDTWQEWKDRLEISEWENDKFYDEFYYNEYLDANQYLTVAIHYDGITIYRSIRVLDLEGVIASLENTEKYYQAYYYLPDVKKNNCDISIYRGYYPDFTAEQLTRIYEAVKQDMAGMSPQEWYSCYNGVTSYDCMLEVEFLKDFKWYEINIPISEKLPQAYRMLREFSLDKACIE